MAPTQDTSVPGPGHYGARHSQRVSAESVWRRIPHFYLAQNGSSLRRRGCLLNSRVFWHFTSSPNRVPVLALACPSQDVRGDIGLRASRERIASPAARAVMGPTMPLRGSGSARGTCNAYRGGRVPVQYRKSLHATISSAAHARAAPAESVARARACPPACSRSTC